ncbi:hypothetical protein POV27_15125 [Aureisphaera galaxeae]|uniref:hypothetical protein n=1 Tax=Aureisphaera galaxeae TaxID=1538023 RepID=UPI00234FC16A|nr:hypothetical protein [Aureisphaera galaxeae]MDC8005394.1 hypothetical protein [Aureisphaera galaxeae]
MNWRFIFFLSPIGVLMGALLVKGIGNPWIIIFWTLFGLLTAYMLSRYIPEKWFPTALAIGTLWGIFHNILESIFFDTYLVNNEGYTQVLSNPNWIRARYWVLLTGPIVGLGTGFLIAIFTWLLKKVVAVKTD